MDNILENDGLYVPEKDVNILLDNVKNPSVESTPLDIEKPRNLPDNVVKELQDAGLLETDFDKIVNKYIVSSVRRAKLQRYVNTYNPVINQLIKDGVMTSDEGYQIKILLMLYNIVINQLKIEQPELLLDF